MFRDLRLALRKLLRQPAFTSLAVLILALGLGATTAMFSLVNAALLRPLPYAEPDRLLRVQVDAAPNENGHVFLTPFLFRHLRANNDVFEGMAAVRNRHGGLAPPGQPPEAISSLSVTSDFFSMLAMRPAVGRTFLAEEDQPGRNGVVVLSDRLWRDRFGGDPGIVGRTLQLGPETVVVIGVMPPAFSDPVRRWTRVDLWRPMAFTPEAMQATSTQIVEVWARLKPGVSPSVAKANLSAVAARLNDGLDREVKLKPLGEKSGLEDETLLAIWFAMGLAVFVLFIACTNLAGLQLARLAARGHEQAIRVAMGASRARLARETVAESLLLSAAGGGLGIVLAVWCTEALAGRLVLTNGQTTVGLPVALDARVLLVALAGVVMSALILGLASAWLSSRGPLFDTLRKGGRGSTGRGRSRLRQGLVVAEMAMALVLLMGGGLFLRGLQRVESGDPGWQTDRILTGRMTLSGPQYREAGPRNAFLDRVQQRLTGLPGVAGSAAASWLPVSSGQRLRLQVDGRPDIAESNTSYLAAVSSEYFATLGIPQREGRTFALTDGFDTQPVVVINETMARELWPGRSALGQRISFAPGDPTAPTWFKAWKTVVGVVADVRFTANLGDLKSRYQAYYPIRQSALSTIWLALRTQGPPEALAGALRQAVAETDPNLVVYETLGARALTDRELTNLNLFARLILGFAGLGLLLAALGVYGLFSGFVAEHTAEIGVRMALGARSGQVLAIVLRKGLRLAGVGAIVGILGALALVPVLRAVAYGLPPHEPVTIFVLALVLMTVAVFACWLPARRAAALDPMVALRRE